MKSLLSSCFLACFFSVAAAAAPASTPPPNILFILADDLRVDSAALTPNLDRLARRGRAFERAYCQQAVCNPSRASMMTGLRPDRLGVHDLVTHFRSSHPTVVTLPQLFRQSGYTAVGIGKVYHNLGTEPRGDPISWSRPEVFHWGNHRIDQATVPGRPTLPLDRVPVAEALDVPDEAYLDGRIAAAGVAALRELKAGPFFLAVGFWKPHLPHNVPRRYWDLYDPAKLPEPTPAAMPSGAPEIAGHGSPEPRGYANFPDQGPIDRARLRTLRHGYLAATSYLDAQVGKLLDALESEGLADRTIIVLVSDNGYHLGEQGLVGKLTNFEIAARVPLVVAVPGMPRPGEPTRALAELVDLYPTLVDLAGLSAPHALEGVSQRPALLDPAVSGKPAALTQHPRPANMRGISAMGYSARTARHRYTEWRRLTSGEVLSRELYDHTVDPAESRNLAASADAGLLRTLAAHLPPIPAKPSTPPPPGVVIHHSPPSSGLFVGSPSIVRLPNGALLASHDYFGPRSREYQVARSRVYRSTDGGVTWSQAAELDGAFWSGLFAHRGQAYLLGTNRHHGDVVIRRSADGRTWTTPSVLLKGQWHTAPVPVVEHRGRLWRGIEDAMNGERWGERYRARVLSVDTDADLLRPSSWRVTEPPLARVTSWLPGNGFAAWLEGNAVVSPEGELVNLLRVDTPGLPEKAALVRVSPDGRSAAFNPTADLLDFPGGAKKFTIRRDPSGSGYWALATVADPGLVGQRRPASVRNQLALVYSPDLRRWEIRSLLIRHPDIARHGFQYADWVFDGDDILAVVRTAWDDAEGGARNNHDANFLTFHRWKAFRKLTRADDAR